MTQNTRRTMLAVLSAAFLACIAAGATVHAALSDTPQVVIKDFMFQPMAVTVKAGVALTWVNRDQEPHTVTSDTGLFRSGALDTDETFAFKFDKPGTYHFLCSIHPKMVGTVVVE
jgi:plastocyanin